MELSLRNNGRKVIITDTSVLVNFLIIDRMDLLEKHPNEFIITDHVFDEVTHYYAFQKQKLTEAIEKKILSIVQVLHSDEIVLFSELQKSKNLGVGECSAIACAVYHGYSLAIDDIRARKQAEKVGVDIINTQDIMISFISQGVITVAEADLIKNEWEIKHKFLLKIPSFREVIS